MKTKNILLVTAASLCLGIFFSFKTLNGESNGTILVSVLNGKGDDNGFMITYGDGRTEKIAFTSKLKALDPGSWVDAQSQATVILNKFKEKGYNFKGTATVYGIQAMVLEKN